MTGDHFDCGRRHRGIVREAEHRQHIGDGADRQHEIGDGPDQRRLDLQGRVAVESTIISGEQIFGERNLRGDALSSLLSRRQNAAPANAMQIIW